MLRCRQSALACGCAAGLLIASGEAQASPSAPAAPFTTPAERCIVPAADYHRVNPYVLRAILKVESGLNPKAIGRNANGTVDLGVGQMNSIHFKELAKHGIAPQQLLDACVGTYVAAWHLGRVMYQHGNTWEGVARYHSITPYFNQRYQMLLVNELVRSGVMQGKIQRVPSLERPSAPAPASTRAPRLQLPASRSLTFDDAAPFSSR